MDDRYRGYEPPDRDYSDYPDYDGDYDFRTWTQKYHDDNTWLKDEGLLMEDGEPALYWCEHCEAVRTWRSYEGSNVYDRYSYILCTVCGRHGDGNHREPTEEELDAYDEGKYDTK